MPDPVTIATWALVVVTGYYAWQAERQAKFTREILQAESNRWLRESRPYVEVRFLEWGTGNQGPYFEIFNVGKWAAVQVRIEPDNIAWTHAGYQNQRSATLGPFGAPPAQFQFPPQPPPVPGRSRLESDWSIEFRITYSDVGNYREFAEKWIFGVRERKIFLLKINATELSKPALAPEEYVLQQAKKQT